MSTFWIAVFGVPAVLALIFAVVALAGRTTHTRRASRHGLAAVLLLVGAATTWWNIMWGTPIWSLEGAWLWPLAVIPLAFGTLVLRAGRRTPSTHVAEQR